MKRITLALLLAVLHAAAGACSLVDSSGVHIDYAFDPQEYRQDVNPGVMGMLPDVACTPGQAPDPCAAVQTQIPPDSGTVACDPVLKKCVATVDISLPQEVDLRQARTPIPDQAVQLGIDAVSVHRVAYWIIENTLNVPTPTVELYVGPQSAGDYRDPRAVKLGSVAPLSAGSNACGDKASTDSEARGKPVCDMQLSADGQRALGDYVKNYRQAPFKLIARALPRAEPGMPLPSGRIHFALRPTVRLTIIK